MHHLPLLFDQSVSGSSRVLLMRHQHPARSTSWGFAAAFFLVEPIRRQDRSVVTSFARKWPKGARAYRQLADGPMLHRNLGLDGTPRDKFVTIALVVRQIKARAKHPAECRPRHQRRTSATRF
ncbi:hypothetical protein VQH23_10625 [Pararoseomonas sp. SCSIO 73927]|uniref:hypothetical protein n=1 Tax=Pararoseomonas sp. SCSIO 73927 TaxID=3114537 RepID=UPI0030CBA633